MATIGLLAYKIVADTTGFSQGVTATRAELRAAKAITEQTMTANERLEESLKGLEHLYNVGAISAETYARAVDQVQHEATQASLAAGEMGAASAMAAGSQDALLASQVAGLPVIGRLNTEMLTFSPATIAASAAVAALAVGVGTAVVGARELASVVVESTEAIMGLDRSAQELGIGAGSLAGLRDAASDAAGMTGDQLDNALGKMNERLADAAANGGPAADTLTQLGLSATALVGAGTEQAFFQIADAIRELPSPMERARVAIDVFGKSGASLLNVFADGSQSMRESIDAAEGIGLALSELDTARVVAMGHAFDDLADVSEGFGNQLAAAVAPSMTAFARTLGDALQQGEPLRGVLDSTVVVVGSLADNLGMFGDVGAIAFGAVAMGAGVFVQAVQLGVRGLAAMDRGLAELGIGEVNEDFQQLSGDMQQLADTTFQAGVQLMADGFTGKFSAAFAKAKEDVESAAPPTRQLGGAMLELAAASKVAQQEVAATGREAERVGRDVQRVANERRRAEAGERRVSVGAVTQGSTAAFSASQASQDAVARQQTRTAERQLAEQQRTNTLLDRLRATIAEGTGITIAEVSFP